MPEYRPATLNGVQGSGYTQITPEGRGEKCEGVFEAPSSVVAEELWEAEAGDFEGVVFDKKGERVRKFRVTIQPLGGRRVRIRAQGIPRV